MCTYPAGREPAQGPDRRGSFLYSAVMTVQCLPILAPSCPRPCFAHIGPPPKPCGNPDTEWQQGVRVGRGQRGTQALTIVERTVFICKERKKACESRTTARRQGCGGDFGGARDGGVGLTFWVVGVQGRQACWEKQEEGDGVLASAKPAGRATEPQGPPMDWSPPPEGTGIQPQTWRCGHPPLPHTCEPHGPARILPPEIGFNLGVSGRLFGLMFPDTWLILPPAETEQHSWQDDRWYQFSVILRASSTPHRFWYLLTASFQSKLLAINLIHIL